MILSSVELTNFKKHKALTVHLTEGLNTITGPNYSGKSTIQQAILYALFGTAAVPGKGGDIHTKGTNGKSSVTLKFSLLGNNYTVERSGSNATLSMENTVLSRSASAVNLAITELMGLTKDQFLKTRVSKQGDAHALLSTRTQELKKLVETLSGCEVVDKLSKKATAELKTSNDHIEILLSTVDTSVDVPELVELVKDLTEEEITYLKTKNKYEQEKQATHTALRNIDSNLAKVRGAHQSYCDLLAERAHAQVTVTQAAQEFTAAEDNDDLLSTKEMTEVEERLACEIVQQKKYQAQVSEFESSTATVHKLEKDLKSEQGKLSNTTAGEDYSSKISDMESILGEATSEEVGLKIKVRALNGLIEGGVCESCKRPLGDLSEEELDAHTSEYQAEKELLLKKSESIRDLKIKLTGLKEVQKSHLKAVEKITECTNKIAWLSTDLETANKAVPHFDAAEVFDASIIDKCRSKLSNHKVAFKLHTEAIRRMDRANKSLAKLDELGDEPDLQGVEGQRAVADRLHTTAMNSLLTLMDEASGVVSDLIEAKTKLDKYKRIYEKVSLLRSSSSGYKAIAKVIKDNRASMMEGIWAGLLEETSDFVSSCTQNDVSAVQTDDDFNLTYTEGDYEHPIEAASGAQKSLIGLGIRLAIANMLPSSVSFILTDEVTADMTEGISAVSMAVMRTASTQTLSISHRVQDITASDNVISLGE